MMLQSSSPSALLTMSLDAVVEELTAHGPRVWNEQVAIADAARQAGLNGSAMFVPRTRLPAGIAWADPCKLVVSQSSWRGATAEVRAQLETAHGIRPEFADHRNLVFSVTRNTTRDDLRHLQAALRDVVVDRDDSDRDWSLSLWPQAYGDRVHEPRVAALSPRQAVPLQRAAGRVAARAITPYPPGIPLVLPGEVITTETLRTIHDLLANCVTVRGLQTGTNSYDAIVVADGAHIPQPRAHAATSDPTTNKVNR
jgi:lysine decarboxylase